jgi:regulator of protease activity HflC (stomatin/prohibitin superfamily)
MTYYDDWKNRLDSSKGDVKDDAVESDFASAEQLSDKGGDKDPAVVQDEEEGKEITRRSWRNWRRRNAQTERSEWHFCDTQPKRIAWGVFTVVIFITSIWVLAASFNKLKSTEYGVQYNTRKKTLADAAKTGGLHIGPPGYEFIKFPSTFITEDLPESTCVSKDGLRVQFAVSYQYSIPREWLVPVVLIFRNFEKWAEVVAAAGNSAVQHTCSEFTITNFQNQRGIIQTRMEANLRLKLEGESGTGVDGVYARAISLQLRNVDLPEEYQQAVREKQSANEDIALAQNQRTQETTKAQTQLLSATEEARKILDTATSDAELLLTEARLKAQETLFALETQAKTIVNVKESLNLTSSGVLAYMQNELIAKAQNLKVSAGEPAELSRKDEL